MIDITEYVKEFFKLEKPPDDWAKVYKSMIVHTRGVKPTELLEIKRPNEPTDVRAYRLANYRPITKGAINQAIDAVYRILFGSNYKIEYSPNIDDYLTEKEFEFVGERLDFKQLFFRHVLRIIFDDPNGLLVWMPVHPEDENIYPIETPENVEVEVKPVYITSTKIHHFSHEVISYEGGHDIIEIPMGNDRKRKEKKPFYFIITHDFIYRLTPFYSTETRKIEWKLEEYFPITIKNGIKDNEREFPTLVAHQLGGNIAISDCGKNEPVRFYDSFFGGFVPFGDEAICAYSDNQAVRVRYNFPFVSVKGQLCTTCKGAKVVTSKEGGNIGSKVICSSCNGSGIASNIFTPLGYYLKEPPAQNDNPEFAASPAMEFYSADVAILQESYNTWKDLLLEGRRAVNLVHTEEAQSGVAKDIDREDKYETLMKISNNFFELMAWSLDIIEAYKVPFKNNRKDSTVTKPVSFSIKTQGQLTEELTDLITKEAPQSYIVSTSKKLAQRLYNDDVKMMKITEVLTIWDALYGLNSTQISSLKASGGATTEDVIKHVQGFSILSQIAEKQKQFVDMETAEIIKLADKQLQTLIPKEVLEPVNTDDGTVAVSDEETFLGKIPLALQQIALARERANTAGDKDLVNKLGAKMDELLAKI